MLSGNASFPEPFRNTKAGFWHSEMLSIRFYFVPIFSGK